MSPVDGTKPSADDFGRHGRAWRETDLEAADLETTIQNLPSGEYRNPIRVVGFNTAEGWCRNVSADVADELRRRCDLQLRQVPENIQEFVEQHESRIDRSQLRLV